MATKADCVRAAMAGGLDQYRATAVVDTIFREQRKLKAAGDLANAEGKVAAALMNEAEAARLETYLAKKAAALTITKRAAFDDFLGVARETGANFADAVEAALWGSHKRFTGSRESASLKTEAYYKLWAGRLVNDLAAIPGADRLMRETPEFSGNVMREMRSPNSTGDALAREVAGVFTRHLESYRQALNNAGANIGKLDNYVPQSHSQRKMLDATQDVWVKRVNELLDWERSFPDVPEAARAELLEDIWRTIVTGVSHERAIPAELAGQSAFRRPRNQARGLEHHRVLHFKDAEAAAAYHVEFGEGTVLDAVVRQMTTATRKLGLMETFGPNPEVMLQDIFKTERMRLRDGSLDEIRATATGKDATRLAKLESAIEDARGKGDAVKAESLAAEWVDAVEKSRVRQLEKLRRAWDGNRGGAVGNALAELLGETKVAHNPKVARGFKAVRDLQSLAKLGGAALSAVADVSVKAISLRHNGENVLSAWRNAFAMRVEFRQSAEMKAVGRSLGVYCDNFLRDFRSRIDTGEGVGSGWLSEKTNLLFKLSGLNLWTESHKAAYGFYLSHRMADNAATAFGKLDANYAASLKRHGLETRWPLIAKLAKKEADGTAYVLPENAYRLKDADLEPHIPEAVQWKNRPAGGESEDLAAWEMRRARELAKAKNGLAVELMRYIADETHYAIIEPDAKTRRWMTLGTNPGTVAGEIARLATQFKSFPVAYGQRVLMERRWQRAADASSITADIPGFMHAAIASSVMGYMAMTAKDLAKGREPRDPAKVETVFAAVMQGGGLGILGDFFLGKVNRFGGGATSSLAGPSAGLFDSLVEVGGYAVRGEMDKMRDVGLRRGLEHTPFINLWWARAALDYAALFHVREWMSPGSLSRTEKAMQKDFNQRYLRIGGLDLTPSHNIKRGGGYK